MKLLELSVTELVDHSLNVLELSVTLELEFELDSLILELDDDVKLSETKLASLRVSWEELLLYVETD